MSNSNFCIGLFVYLSAVYLFAKMVQEIIFIWGEDCFQYSAWLVVESKGKIMFLHFAHQRAQKHLYITNESRGNPHALSAVTPAMLPAAPWRKVCAGITFLLGLLLSVAMSNSAVSFSLHPSVQKPQPSLISSPLKSILQSALSLRALGLSLSAFLHGISENHTWSWNLNELLNLT